MLQLHGGGGSLCENSQRPIVLGQCAVAQEVKKVFAHAASCLHPKDETFGARVLRKDLELLFITFASPFRPLPSQRPAQSAASPRAPP